MRQYVKFFESSMGLYTQDMAQHDTLKILNPNDRKHIFGKDQEYISQELGEKIGLQIWHKWHMPYGWSETQTYRIFFSNFYAYLDSRNGEFFKRCQDIVREMIKLNPEITEITDYNKFMPDIIHGMISRFNIHDIIFFIDFKRKGELPSATAMRDTEYRGLENNAERLLNKVFTSSNKNRPLRIGWVAAPVTLERIYNKLKELQKHKIRK